MMTTATIDWPSWLSVTSRRVQCGDGVMVTTEELPMEMVCPDGEQGTLYNCRWHNLMVRVVASDTVAGRLPPDAYGKLAKIIATTFRRRVWRKQLERCNEANGYGWDEDTLGKIEVVYRQGDEDGQRRWLDGIKEVFGIALTDEQICSVLSAVRDYEQETQELPA